MLIAEYFIVSCASDEYVKLNKRAACFYLFHFWPKNDTHF